MVTETTNYENLLSLIYSDVEKYMDETLYNLSDASKPLDLNFIKSRFNKMSSLVRVLTKTETSNNDKLCKAQGFLNILHEYIINMPNAERLSLSDRLY